MGCEGIRGRTGARAVGTNCPHIHRLAHPLPGPRPHYRRLIISTRLDQEGWVDNERDALYNIPSTVQPIGPAAHLTPAPEVLVRCLRQFLS